MKFEQELLVSISRRLARRYGEDIAHDVVIALLRRRNPIRQPEHWAHAYAAGLARRENTRVAKVKVFADIGMARQSMLAEHLGY